MLPLTELGHGRQGQPKEMGGSEMGKQPTCQGERPKVYTSMHNAPTYREVPTPIMEGWLHALQSSQAEMTEHEVVLFKRKGGIHVDP